MRADLIQLGWVRLRASNALKTRKLLSSAFPHCPGTAVLLGTNLLICRSTILGRTRFAVAVKDERNLDSELSVVAELRTYDKFMVNTNLYHLVRLNVRIGY